MLDSTPLEGLLHFMAGFFMWVTTNWVMDINMENKKIFQFFLCGCITVPLFYYFW